jgi:hypothetical protein
METMVMTPELFTEESDAFPKSNTPFWLSPAGLRPVDWRWRVASRSFLQKMPRRAVLDDPWVRRITKHLRSRDKVPKSRVSSRASHDHVLSEASAIRFAPDPQIGSELDSWLLTGEPRCSVAEITGVDEAVIEVYEQCFFDVREKLNVVSYVVHIVIGSDVYQGFRLDNLPAIWKMIAYFRGKFSLAVALQTFPGSRQRPWPEWYPASAEEQARLTRACRRAILARCLPRDVSSIRQLKLLLQLQAAAEADYKEEFGSTEPVVPPLTSATISSALELSKSSEPVPSTIECWTEDGAATAKLTESCRRNGLQEALTG